MGIWGHEVGITISIDMDLSDKTLTKTAKLAWNPVVAPVGIHQEADKRLRVLVGAQTTRQARQVEPRDASRPWWAPLGPVLVIWPCPDLIVGARLNGSSHPSPPTPST